MPEFVIGLSQVPLPRMTLVRQDFPAPVVADVAAAVARELDRPEIAASVRPSSRVAVAVGSRGIHGIDRITAALVRGLKARGAQVVIIPAMGSHGGATAAGQTEVLARYGVSAAAMGAEVVSAMETECVGRLRRNASGAYEPSSDERDIPVHLDRVAARDVDLVVPVVRVKPHTGFRGTVESGICKMLAIGLGKHEGCSRLHREGYGNFAELIPAAARLVLATGKIAFSLAVVENALERTAQLEAVAAQATLSREPQLLAIARALMPRILLPEIDVLVVERIGKDISGVGMDANVTGRSELGGFPDFSGPRIARIVVLGLTPATKGNATGIGHADVITEEAFRGIDRAATATNVVTSGSLRGGRIPVAIAGEDDAIRAAMSCVPGIAAADARVVRIRDTLHLCDIAVSANLLPVVASTAGCRAMGAFAGSWPPAVDDGGAS
ncbi:MAG: hypothetical protein H0W83_02545 [Planctomycetes bacterium]|nr:hypothetical protein [Planctomycetota bacterium]